MQCQQTNNIIQNMWNEECTAGRYVSDTHILVQFTAVLLTDY